MAPELQVRCLGRLSLRCWEAPEVAASDLPLPATLKAQSLLAYLVAHRDRPQSRDHLAELFWGDRPEHNARRSLATALWQIRRCLPGDDFILADTARRSTQSPPRVLARRGRIREAGTLRALPPPMSQRCSRPSSCIVATSWMASTTTGC